MRILLEIAGLHLIGGVTTFVGELANALAKKGEVVTIATSRKFGGDADFVPNENVSVKSFRDLECSGERFDIVHINGLWDYDVYWASGWAIKNGMPLVWSPHGMLSPWALRRRWWKKCLPWLLYLRWRIKKASVIHVTSDLERVWVEKLGLGPIEMAPLGTHLPALSSSHIFFNGVLRLLFVGRVHPVKGLDKLLQAIALLPKGSLLLKVVGSDDVGYMATLAALANTLGIQDSVVFVGPKFGDALEAEYEVCDLLILPSRTENFGGVVVDALAHGRPVIASTNTPWQSLEERRCGWWVSNDPKVLARTLMCAMDSDVLAGMGRRGREFVADEFSWENVASKMIEIYGGINVKPE